MFNVQKKVYTSLFLITVIHVSSNNITHRIFESFNADKLEDEIIDIGKMCRQYRVKEL